MNILPIFLPPYQVAVNEGCDRYCIVAFYDHKIHKRYQLPEILY